MLFYILIWSIFGLISLSILYSLMSMFQEKLEKVNLNKESKELKKLLDKKIGLDAIILALILGPLHFLSTLLVYKEFSKLK